MITAMDYDLIALSCSCAFLLDLHPNLASSGRGMAMHQSTVGLPELCTLEYACLIGILSGHRIKGVMLRLARQQRQAALIALLDALVPS